jgi:hypothetical protein
VFKDGADPNRMVNIERIQGKCYGVSGTIVVKEVADPNRMVNIERIQGKCYGVSAQ